MSSPEDLDDFSAQSAAALAAGDLAAASEATRKGTPIHGRMGLDRPFRNLKSVRERDEAALRQEILDQVATDETVL